MIERPQPFVHLHTSTASVILDCRGNQPVLAYFGSTLSKVDVDHLNQFDRHQAPASLPIEPKITLTPTIGESYLGHLGLEVRRDNANWGLLPRLVKSETTGLLVTLTSLCDLTKLEITHRLRLDPKAAVVRLAVSVQNICEKSVLSVDTCALTLPLPDHLVELQDYRGRWGYEFQTNRQTIGSASYVRENWTGRTSHHLNPTITLLEKQTGPSSGAALGLHIGWSGNHHIRIETLADGRRVLQAGELLRPGEIGLLPGEAYDSPEIFLCHSSEGFNTLTQQWHSLIRSTLNDSGAVSSSPRPVQLNTWEALYFDVNAAATMELIEHASALGIERFVLDDGWFVGRTDDRRALGDWQVDPDKFPAGLAPIAQACINRNMEFGLWIEPEMISRESQLYREHPDWVLTQPGVPLIEARQQLVLDLSQPAVARYLFEALSGLLSTLPITYLKWDMNRDIHQAGNANGDHAIHQQTRSLYALLARLRRAFPNVAIETCASGGGRADLGILAFTTRVWPSDTNDALDRLHIQRGFQALFPPEVMGSHVGPSPCHLTGRQHTMTFRAGVALWGHMGVEADIREMNLHDRQVLTQAISLHKQYRRLLHAGDYLVINRPDGEMAWAVINEDQSEGLFALAMLDTPSTPFPSRYRCIGLDPSAEYAVSLVWPSDPRAYVDEHKASLSTATFDGVWLMSVGLSLPIINPETLCIYHIKAVEQLTTTQKSHKEEPQRRTSLKGPNQTQ